MGRAGALRDTAVLDRRDGSAVRQMRRPLREAAPAPDEVALVEASIDGQVEAFSELYVRFYPRIRAFCLRKTGDPELAQDITHEAFTRAFKNIDRFGGPKKFGGWVGTIAANLITDHYRRKSTSDISLDQWADADRLQCDRHDPMTNLEREAARTVVRPALDQLNPRQREALLLREIEGMSCADIGKRLGITESAAESLVARGRVALRKQILAKAGPQHELFGLGGSLGLVGGIGAAFRRLRATVGQKIHHAQTATHRMADWAAATLPLGHAAKVAVVAATAIAIEQGVVATQHAKPKPAPAVMQQKKLEVGAPGGAPSSASSAAKGTAPTVARPLETPGALDTPAGTVSVDLDPASGKAKGSAKGSVGTPKDPKQGDDGGGAAVNYKVDVGDDGANAGASVEAGGQTLADTGDITVP